MGCETWSQKFRGQNSETQPSILSPNQMSPDSVVIEISIISIPNTKLDLLEAFWESLDYTKVDLDQRKSWDRNGMRAATSGSQLPIEFQQLLEVENRKTDNDGLELTEESKLAPRRRIQSRAGKPFRIATQSTRPELTWIVEKSDGYRIGGSKLSAQSELVARSIPQGSGGVRLLIEPEIVYGEPRQVVTSASQSLRYEMKRDSIPFPDIKLDVDLALGESLILTAIPSADSEKTFGLGRTFFSTPDGFQKFIVVRIAQTQRDDLFNSDEINAQLESITE
jgi:hypothetical protein